MTSSPLLEARGVTAFYGQAQVLFGLDLTVRSGEVVAMLGRNGVGKTTMIRAICRLTPPQSGVITLAGRDLAGLAPHQAARLGLGLVPEGRRCFAPLTVHENVIAAARPGRWDWRAVCALFPRLRERSGQIAGALSGGEQQMLAIARALATNPRLLILDEATEGLAPTVRAEIWDALRRMKQDGASILLVDKNLAELAPIADSCVIVKRGRTVWTGPPADLSPAVRAAHLEL